MKKILSKFTWKSALVLAIGLASVLVIVPRVATKNLSANAGCQPVFDYAIFNAYPLSYSGDQPCTELPFMQSRVVRNGQVGTWAPNSVNAQGGDEVDVVMYVHNSARVDGIESQTTARGIQISTNVDMGAGSSHNVSANVTSSNAQNSLSGSFTINTPEGATLEVVPGSQKWMQVGGGFNDVSLVNNTASLPDQQACYEFRRFIYFTVRVVAPQQPAPADAHISANLSGGANAQCIYTGTVTVDTSNIDTVMVTVNDMSVTNDYSADKVMAIHAGGHTVHTTPWIEAQKEYRFALWWMNPPTGGETRTFYGNNGEVHTYNVRLINEAWIRNAPACAVNPPVEGPKSFNLSVNPTEICAPDYITFTVSSATANLNGKEIKWSSTKNGVSTGEVDSGYGHIVQNGYWSQGDAYYGTDKVGSWTKTATIDGVSRTVSFVVKNCVNPPPPVATCPSGAVSVSPAAIYVGAYAYASAPYGWYGGSFSVSNANVASIYSNSVQGKSAGTVTISGSGFTAPNGATNCPLSPATLTVQQANNPPPYNPPPYNPPPYNPPPTSTPPTQLYNGAVCVDTTYPSNITPGQTFRASVTMRNSGTKPWTQPWYNLGSQNPQDNTRWGISRIGLPFTPVNPGQNVTFTFDATAPLAAGSYAFDWRMVQDGVEWFGSTCSRTITVSSPVNPGQPSLLITKEVKNMGPSQTSGFASWTWAKQGDTVQYRITVKNIGNGAASNVFVSDSLPSGLSDRRNPSVSKSFTGALQSGLSLGTLEANETVTITYDATVSVNSGQVTNTATVSASNAASQSSSAQVIVQAPTPTPTPTPTQTGTCVNNSCNNTNNQTSNGNNSPNQNNQSVIVGNNNTVTQTNNNCVNNSCNTYYIYNNQTVPANEYRQLSITKGVRLMSGGTFQNSVTANSNDTVEFEVVVTNSGNQTVNNVRMQDNLPWNLSLVNGSVRVDGSQVSDSNLGNAYLGSLSVGQSKRITFQARVNTGNQTSVQNVASASGDNAPTVQDDAWVFTSQVAGGSVSLAYSKKAWNDTKNADAQSVAASREDYITYTLTVTNNGNTPAQNFIITDDLSTVLPYADVVDNGGGQVSGNVISYPGITVPAGGSVSKSFRVRVKYHLADNLSYVMTNTYGNTVTVRINTPQVKGAFVAPKTGSDAGAAGMFGGLMTVSFFLARKRKDIMNMILA